MESIVFIGQIHSSLKELKDCPLQENERAPTVLLTINEKYRQAISGLTVGSKILLFTWLHKADRNTLLVKPRQNPNAELKGVFATRSPNRPNPIGIHNAEILDISIDGKIKISNLEVLDNTPLIDIKPVIH